MKFKKSAWDHISNYYRANEPDNINERLRFASEINISEIFLFTIGHIDRCDEYLKIAADNGISVHLIVIPFASDILKKKLLARLKTPENWASEELRFEPCVNSSRVRNEGLESMKYVINKYHERIAGIHLDYIRDDNALACLNTPCECLTCCDMRELYFGKKLLSKQERNLPGVIYKELDFKNRNITTFLVEAGKLTKDAGLGISMAARANYCNQPDFEAPPVYGLGPALVEGQDWVEWARNDLVKSVHTMNYHIDPVMFKETFNTHLRLMKGFEHKLYTGLGVESSLGINSPERINDYLTQVVEAGLPGCTFFHFRAINEEYGDVIKSFN